MDSQIRGVASKKLDAIEGEMRRAGAWRASPLDPAALQFREPFGADTMTYLEWLQFVFLPRARALTEEGESFPSSSSLGAKAAREFDGRPELDRLAALLSDFDAWVNAGVSRAV